MTAWPAGPAMALLCLQASIISPYPIIIYWNLSNSKTSVQAHSKMPGVQLLGGSSASNFKYILHGEMADEITETVDPSSLGE